jgi:hypothetical protein
MPRLRVMFALAVVSLAAVPTVAAAGPPDGELTVDGRGPTIGVLGTYCYFGDGAEGCHDAEWIIPRHGPRAPEGAAFVFALADHSSISSWNAEVAPAVEGVDSVPEPDTDWLAGAEDTSVDSLSFTGPPAGDWVLRVSVEFESGGGAQYYYRLHVGMPETATAPAPVPPAVPDPDHWLFMALAALAGAVIGWRIRAKAAPPTRNPTPTPTLTEGPSNPPGAPAPTRQLPTRSPSPSDTPPPVAGPIAWGVPAPFPRADWYVGAPATDASREKRTATLVAHYVEVC